ncbi:hypothetical protein ABK040_008555 [Willaertia magna]
MKRQQQTHDTFLFATNDVIDTELNNLQNEKIDATKWNTLKFPENCKIIKKIVCGAQFIVICNEQNELYYFGNFENKTNYFWNKLNIKNNNLKNIFATYSNLFIQLNNDYILIYKNGKLQHLIHTLLMELNLFLLESNSFIVIDNKPDSKLRCDHSVTLNCSGTSSFGELGNLHSTLEKFQQMRTPFESEIVDVKGGYHHFVVLLKSGIVFAIGYNELGAVNVYDQNNVKQFTKLTHPLFENEFINRSWNCFNYKK